MEEKVKTMLIAVDSLLPDTMKTDGRSREYWIMKYEDDTKDKSWRKDIVKKDAFALGIKLGNKILDYYSGDNVDQGCNI